MPSDLNVPTLRAIQETFYAPHLEQHAPPYGDDWHGWVNGLDADDQDIFSDSDADTLWDRPIAQPVQRGRTPQPRTPPLALTLSRPPTPPPLLRPRPAAWATRPSPTPLLAPPTLLPAFSPETSYFDRPLTPLQRERLETAARAAGRSPSPLVWTPLEEPPPVGPVRRGNSLRAAQRETQRRLLRQHALAETPLGRVILGLKNYDWVRLPNGLTAMQFSATESRWRANDTANYITWLGCGAYAHRSFLLNIIAIANIEDLAPLFRQSGVPPIEWSYAPRDWPPRPADARRPHFVADSFRSPHQRDPA